MRRSVEGSYSMEKMFERILCPIDFSPHSAMAMKKAASLAKNFGSELILAHVITNPESDIYSEKLSLLIDSFKIQKKMFYPASAISIESLVQAVEEMVRDYAEEQGICEPFEIHVEKTHEHTYKGITGYAEERGVDLIVMSTHGYIGAKRIYLGSVAENVVRRAPCSVFVVRSKEMD